MTDDANEIRDWWRTSIIDMRPSVIRFRGFPIEELLGNISFSAMIWLMGGRAHAFTR
jgi:citrate synthase